MIRTERQAAKEAHKRWGEKGAVRDLGRGGWPTKEHREAMRAELTALRALPPTDDLRERSKRKQRMADLTAGVLAYRFAVGRINPYLGAFVIEGDGDSWTEAFEKADRAKRVVAISKTRSPSP